MLLISFDHNFSVSLCKDLHLLSRNIIMKEDEKNKLISHERFREYLFKSMIWEAVYERIL